MNKQKNQHFIMFYIYLNERNVSSLTVQRQQIYYLYTKIYTANVFVRQ